MTLRFLVAVHFFRIWSDQTWID